MIEIKKYTAEDAAEWDFVIERSRNGTFLHYRNYMDYHSDRFQDFSLIVLRADKPVAVFPASVASGIVTSHGGLTYGGLLSVEDLCADETLQAVQQIGSHYKANGIEKILIKTVPYIFHRYPCQEELYALFRVDAKLVRRDASSVIELNKKFSYSKGRKWSINKARKAGVIVKKTLDPISFYTLLTAALKKFDATPTHSIEEIRLLMQRFPENVSIYEAHISGNISAGAIIYDFGDAVHTQYLATSEDGRNIGSLDFLLAELIQNVYADRKFFSFGISTEQSGHFLNTGLIAQKEGFGARTVVHDFYEWTL